MARRPRSGLPRAAGETRRCAAPGGPPLGGLGRAQLPRLLLVVQALLCLLVQPAQAQASIDGGRSELPGMKQDIFDQVQRNKKSGGPTPRGKAPPDCPRSDLMSPFYGLAFVSGEVYVKLNSTDGGCEKLITLGGVNYTEMKNASRTCGPAGESKIRIAQNLSSVFFQGGWDWVRSENETIEIVTEEGTFQVEVNEAKYAELLSCWKYSCGCEQAKNPVGRMILLTMLVVALGGLSYDSLKVMWQKIMGKKPPKHVECKRGHRIEEVKFARSHYCDVCGAMGTMYQCSVSCNYDMCKKCYKEAKKKVKAAYKEWLDKHPEEKAKAKKEDKDDKDDDDEKDKSEKETASGEDLKDGKSDAESTDAPKASSDTKSGEGNEEAEEEAAEGAAAEGETPEEGDAGGAAEEG